MTTADAASATPLLISHEQHEFRFDPSLPPAVTVEPGTRVRVRTLDCFCNAITSSDQLFQRDSDLMEHVPGLNPLTGPIAIQGALPGDTLIVRIERIELAALAPFAVTTVIPGAGGPTGRSGEISALPADTRILRLEGNRIAMPTRRGTLWLPVRPMIGSIGTAPADRGFPALETHPACGGNMDCVDITDGSTLMLPVQTPGALLSLGDVHASMGDAEVTGTAFETSAEITLSLDVVPGSVSTLSIPRLETPAGTGSIGCTFGAPLEANLETAFADLLDRLRSDYGLAAVEAYELLGAVARVRVNQCVPGGWSSVYVWIPRECLPAPLPA